MNNLTRRAAGSLTTINMMEVPLSSLPPLSAISAESCNPTYNK